MKKIMLVLMILLMVSGCAAAQDDEALQQTPAIQTDNPETIVDEASGREYSAHTLVFTVKEGTDEAEISKFAEKYGLKYSKFSSLGNIYLLESATPLSKADLAKIKNDLEQQPYCESAEYDYIIRLTDPVEVPISDH